MCFKYWVNEPLPTFVAHRYVCMPHIPGFWDRITVGQWTLSTVETMLDPDYHLPKLFNVVLGPNRSHWCCFVFKTHITLAMWCTTIVNGEQRILPLVDTAMTYLIENTEFRRMVVCLSRWFTVQYTRPEGRHLKVVLDCKPSEGTLVHMMASLAYRSGMQRFTPVVIQRRSSKDCLNYTLDIRAAETLFTSPIDVTDVHGMIDIVGAYNRFNGSDVAVHYVYTDTEYLSCYK